MYGTPRKDVSRRYLKQGSGSADYLIDPPLNTLGRSEEAPHWPLSRRLSGGVLFQCPIEGGVLPPDGIAASAANKTRIYNARIVKKQPSWYTELRILM